MIGQTAVQEDVFSFGQEEIEKSSGHAVERSVAKGESLWDAGDDPEAVWLVRRGRVNMVIESPEGAAAVIHFCTRGQTFCPAAALSGRPYPCTAVAAEDCAVVALPRAAFLKLCAGMPEFARRLVAQMGAQVCEAHCRQALNTAPVRSRLAGLLGDLNRRYAGRDLPFTRQELANMVGTTVESAIRTLSQWEKNGVIESGRGSIHVRRPRALDEAAGACSADARTV